MENVTSNVCRLCRHEKKSQAPEHFLPPHSYTNVYQAQSGGIFFSQYYTTGAASWCGPLWPLLSLQGPPQEVPWWHCSDARRASRLMTCWMRAVMCVSEKWRVKRVGSTGAAAPLAVGISSCVRRSSLARVTTCWLAQKIPAYWFCSTHMNCAVILFPLTRGFSCAWACECVNWMCVFHGCFQTINIGVYLFFCLFSRENPSQI